MVLLESYNSHDIILFTMVFIYTQRHFKYSEEVIKVQALFEYSLQYILNIQCQYH